MMVDGKARVTGDDSMYCGHCVAVCPAEAVRLPGIEPPRFDTVSITGDTAVLVDLMRRRRSVRVYTEAAVARGVFDDIVRAGILAPSGTNAQKWTFTVLPTRASMERFAAQIARFYERINRMAENRALRFLSSLTPKNVLGGYYRRYYPSVKEALDEWRNNRRDMLFHGATAGIVIASQPGASCGPEDALLAAQNMSLFTHSIGLGSCLIGFAVEAMKRSSAIQQSLGIPESETVHAVLALGHPTLTYPGVTGRKVPVVRYAD